MISRGIAIYFIIFSLIFNIIGFSWRTGLFIIISFIFIIIRCSWRTGLLVFICRFCMVILVLPLGIQSSGLFRFNLKATPQAQVCNATWHLVLQLTQTFSRFL